MIDDPLYKKGDMIRVHKVKKTDKGLKKGNAYQISHSVMQAHESLCIYKNDKSKAWTLVSRDQVEKVI